MQIINRGGVPLRREITYEMRMERIGYGKERKSEIMNDIKRYTATRYAAKMGVSKQHMGRLIAQGKIETVWVEEIGKRLILDTIKNRDMFSNPSPHRGEVTKSKIKTT